jgi:hypothetical protein
MAVMRWMNLVCGVALVIVALGFLVFEAAALPPTASRAAF